MAVLAVGAAARITRFVNADDLAGPIRNRWRAKFGDHTTAGGFISCPWCVGFWAAVPVVAAAGLFGDTPFFWGPAGVLTVSYVVGLLAGIDRE